MGEGKRVSNALREKKLISSKSEDMLYMQRERERIDQMERERLAEIAAQKARSSKQEGILVIGSVLLVLVVVSLIVVIAMLAR
jgi:hypothetical protein